MRKKELEDENLPLRFFRDEPIDTFIFEEYKVMSREDAKEELDDFLNYSGEEVNLNLKKSFQKANNLFQKALENSLDGCRCINIKGWRVVVLNLKVGLVIEMEYFNPEIFGFRIIPSKEFVARIFRESSHLLPMFLGVGQTLDAEIEKVLKR